MAERIKIVRVTTVPISMNIILKGQLRFINQYFEVIGVTGDDGHHFREIGEREGIAMHAIKMSRVISIAQDLRALWKLFIFFRRLKPAIVHSHTPKAGLLAMIAAFFAGVPVRLHTVAGLPLLETRGVMRAVLNLMERLTYYCADMVYPNSLGLRNIILKNGFCTPSKLKVIGNGSSNGIDTNFFSRGAFASNASYEEQIRLDYGVGRDDFVFCFVGRIAKEKGIKELVDAFTGLVRENGMDFKMKLLLVGPFEEENGTLDEATRRTIFNNPCILSVGRHDDIRPFLFISQVFVFPSYREGFPSVVLQAGAMGLPCIVTNINGCNEIIDDNLNGIIIQPKNSQQLHEAMQRTLVDEALRDKLAFRSRERIEMKYQNELVWQGLLKEYYGYVGDKL